MMTSEQPYQKSHQSTHLLYHRVIIHYWFNTKTKLKLCLDFYSSSTTDVLLHYMFSDITAHRPAFSSPVFVDGSF